MMMRIIALMSIAFLGFVQLGKAQTVDVSYLNPKHGSPTSSYAFLRLGTSTQYWAGWMYNNTSAGYGDGNDVSLFTYNDRDLTFYTGVGDFIVFPSYGGNMGVGTTSPQHKLEINGDVSIGRSDGTAMGYGDRLHFKGSSFNSDALWMARFNSAGNASELRINLGDDKQAEDKFVIGSHYYNDNSWNPTLSVQANGKVGIGTSTPDAPLTVKGRIHAEEVKVDLSVPAPDYVFAPDYQLSSLQEIEAYIQENSHLPEVPSAAEMEAEGIELSKMNMLLLKKVEELTLHLILLNKALEQKVIAEELMKKRLDAMEMLLRSEN